MPIVTPLTKMLGIRMCVFSFFRSVDHDTEPTAVLLYKEGCNGTDSISISEGYSEIMIA